MPTSKPLLALILIFLLISPTRVVLAQQPPGPAPAPVVPGQQPPVSTPALIVETLKIIVLEGEGAINNIEKHMAKIPVVEVRDENDKPVEGVEVIFRLPPTGPGGSFADQKPSKVAKTNVQGQAAATGFIPNSQSGRFTIKVTASIGNRVGETTISQTNAIGIIAATPQKPKFLGLGWKKLAIIGGIATGAIVGILVATRGGSGSNPTITITPGPVTIGGR